jgi:hypothetical protein
MVKKDESENLIEIFNKSNDVIAIISINLKLIRSEERKNIDLYNHYKSKFQTYTDLLENRKAQLNTLIGNIFLKIEPLINIKKIGTNFLQKADETMISRSKGGMKRPKQINEDYKQEIPKSRGGKIDVHHEFKDEYKSEERLNQYISNKDSSCMF